MNLGTTTPATPAEQRFVNALPPRARLLRFHDVLAGNKATLALVRSLVGQAGGGWGVRSGRGVQQVQFML